MLIFILNILWFVLGGFFAGLGWVLAGVIMALTIIGIPWARSCFMLARYTFWPFGYDIVPREQLTGEPDIGTGAARHHRQHHLVCAGGLVAGHHAHLGGAGPCHHHHRHPLRLGPREARHRLAVSDRQDGGGG